MWSGSLDKQVMLMRNINQELEKKKENKTWSEPRKRSLHTPITKDPSSKKKTSLNTSKLNERAETRKEQVQTLNQNLSYMAPKVVLKYRSGG